MANVLTPEQIEEFQDAFAVIDKNSDGLITSDELIKILVTLEGSPTAEVVQEMINEFDLDGDGAIDFDEFLKVMSRRMHGNVGGEELYETFTLFDRDEDGYLCASELRRMMHGLGENVSEEEAEEMVRQADLDGDGVLSYREFARIMMTF